MITEQQVTIRTQTASDGNWLYQEQTDGSRIFTKSACLGAKAEPWPECTDEEKAAWEEAHKPAEQAANVEDVQEAEVVE